MRKVEELTAETCRRASTAMEFWLALRARELLAAESPG